MEKNIYMNQFAIYQKLTSYRPTIIEIFKCDFWNFKNTESIEGNFDTVSYKVKLRDRVMEKSKSWRINIEEWDRENKQKRKRKKKLTKQMFKIIFLNWKTRMKNLLSVQNKWIKHGLQRKHTVSESSECLE